MAVWGPLGHRKCFLCINLEVRSEACGRLPGRFGATRFSTMAVEVPMSKASPLASASEAIARHPVLVAVWGSQRLQSQAAN